MEITGEGNPRRERQDAGGDGNGSNENSFHNERSLGFASSPQKS
jgi:hypothetical protein